MLNSKQIQERYNRAIIKRLSLNKLIDRLKARRGVAVLCYHTLEEELADYPYRTRTQAFVQHLDLVKEIFDVIPVMKAVQLLDERKLAGRDRPVAVITFDDGFRDNLYTATPILIKHNIPALLFPAKNYICSNTRTYLNEAELQSLSYHPLWKVGAHSVSHNSMYSLVQEDLEREIADSKQWLFELTGYIPDAFAYPQGKVSTRVVAAVRSHFSYACTTTNRLCDVYDRYQIRRICMDARHDDLTAFAKVLALEPWEGEEH